MSKSIITFEMKRECSAALISLIEKIITEFEATSDDDKLLFASLKELKLRVERRLLDYRVKYTFSLPATEAIALRIMYTDYVDDKKSYMGIQLLELSNKIHQTTIV